VVKTVKLTDAYITDLKPTSSVITIKDTEVKNLRVLVQVSGSKAFYVQHGQKKRKIADTNQLSVKQARLEAVKLLSVGLARHKLSGKSLATAFTEYFNSKPFSTGFESNLKQAKRIFSKLLPRPIESITKEDISNCVITSKRVDGKAFADATKDSALNVLSSVFTYQIALEAIEDNPVRNVKKRLPPLEINKRPERISNQQDLTAFLEWCNSGITAGTGVSPTNVKDFELTQLTVKFLLLTGCRVGEAINLRKEDFWLNSEQLTDDSGSLQLRTITFRNTKNGKDHILQVTRTLNSILESALQLTTADNPFIFRIEARNKVISERSMYSRIERNLKKLIIDNQPLRPHDLRRTFAYLATRAGLTEDDVSLILNHTKGSMTERYKGELIELTHGILQRYESYLHQLLTTTDDEYQYKGLGLLTGDTRHIEQQPLEQVRLLAQHHQDNYFDYYN